MPQQQALPTWVALNNANNGSPTGITDVNTGQPIAAGGLNGGDYFDLTNDEAAAASYTTNGLCYAGRYRWVKVDSGATVANVKTGTIGYLRNGIKLASAVTITAGSGQNNGTFQIAANISSGGGSGAIISVTIAGGAIVGQPTVINGGFGYTSVPTFTVAQGGTPGTVAGQLNTTPNSVTSADQIAAVTAIAVRPVVFLNAPTPGNWTFIQELGTATVLGKSTISGGAAGNYVNAVASDNGVVTTTAATGSPIGTTIGVAIDIPLASNLFKIQMGYAAMVVQD